VPAPDAIRLAVPKAYITLTANSTPDRATALSIFQHLRATTCAVQACAAVGVRRFAEDDIWEDPPCRATTRRGGGGRRRIGRGVKEFREEDFPELDNAVDGEKGPCPPGIAPLPPNPLPQGEGEDGTPLDLRNVANTFHVSRAIGLSKFR